MAQYKLTDADYNILDKLFKISNRIADVYELLTNLENKEGKDSEVFKNTIISLNALLQIENFLYHKIGEEPRRVTEMLFHLFGYNKLVTSDTINMYCGLSRDAIIDCRISRRLEMMINNLSIKKSVEEQVNEDDIYGTDEYPEVDDLCEDDIESDNDESVFEEKEQLPYEYYIKLDNQIEEDFLNTLLKLLDDYLTSDDYENIKKILIKYKYFLSFIFNQIEIKLLANNFNIDTNLYWGSDMIADYYEDDPNALKKIRETYAEEIIYVECDNLINKMLEDMNNSQNYGSAIISQMLIRSALLFVSDFVRDGIEEYIHLELDEMDIKNQIVEDIIKNSINKSKLDQQRIRILRMYI